VVGLRSIPNIKPSKIDPKRTSVADHFFVTPIQKLTEIKSLTA
jgi:hypothetical protein